MTWHFTHDKKETIMALLHDVGTPCFAHCIDYVFGDYLDQESSEKSIIEMINKDKKLQSFLKEDHVSIEELNHYSNYHILENKAPKLCTDRLDGVLYTCYIWLHTHSLEQIKEVYDDLVILTNEYGHPEIGFTHSKVCENFVFMVYQYAKELQGNTDKFVMKYISEIVKLAFKRNLVSLDDLYVKKEEEICEIFDKNFLSWSKFKATSNLIRTEEKPKDRFYISFDTKKRNTIPLIGDKRIIEVSREAKKCYDDLGQYKDSKYAYAYEIKDL